jgi:DNA modification methylase
MTNDMWLPDIEYCLCIKGKNAPRYNDGYELKSKFYISKKNRLDKDLYKHPTIKPLDLVKRHILHSSQPNDLVLDCFCGSGTTCVACKETGRRFIGMEIDKEYHKIAVNRLNGITADGQLSLFTDIEQLELENGNKTI